MYSVPAGGPWWPAVGAPLERGVRQRCVHGRELMPLDAGDSACREAPEQEQSRYSASAVRASDFAWRAAPYSAGAQQAGCLLTSSAWPGSSGPAQDAQSLIRLNDDAGSQSGKLSPWPPLAASPGSTSPRARMASGLAVVSPVRPVWSRAVSRGLAAPWLFSSRRQALTLLAHHRPFLRCLTFELSGRQRWDARARRQRMYSVPAGGPWWPAVGAPLERGVRRHCRCG
jgi:hypothetical protein